jgi:hypothetical protein
MLFSDGLGNTSVLRELELIQLRLITLYRAYVLVLSQQPIELLCLPL